MGNIKGDVLLAIVALKVVVLVVARAKGGGVGLTPFVLDVG